jgi:hypothetical protein
MALDKISYTVKGASTQQTGAQVQIAGNTPKAGEANNPQAAQPQAAAIVDSFGGAAGSAPKAPLLGEEHVKMLAKPSERRAEMNEVMAAVNLLYQNFEKLAGANEMLLKEKMKGVAENTAAPQELRDACNLLLNSKSGTLAYNFAGNADMGNGGLTIEGMKKGLAWTIEEM